MDKCLVTEAEWTEMLTTNMTQAIDNDPFVQWVSPEEEESGPDETDAVPEAVKAV